MFNVQCTDADVSCSIYDVRCWTWWHMTRVMWCVVMCCDVMWCYDISVDISHIDVLIWLLCLCCCTSFERYSTVVHGKLPTVGTALRQHICAWMLSLIINSIPLFALMEMDRTKRRWIGNIQQHRTRASSTQHTSHLTHHASNTYNDDTPNTSQPFYMTPPSIRHQF